MTAHPSASELVTWLERQGSPATTVHVQSCVRCRSEVERLRGLTEFVRAAAAEPRPIPAATPFDDLRPELALRTAELLRGPSGRRRRDPRWSLAFVAAAAALLLGLWLGWPSGAPSSFDAVATTTATPKGLRGADASAMHFVLDLPQRMHVAILAITDDGEPAPLYPDRNPLLGRLGMADPLGPVTALRLPPEPALDFDLGGMPPASAFLVIGSEQPLDAARVQQLATTLHDELAEAPAEAGARTAWAAARLRAMGLEVVVCRTP